nr:MAG TPA: hypothetical protein [Caudoviricetes sp.]
MTKEFAIHRICCWSRVSVTFDLDTAAYSFYKGRHT